MKLIIKTILLLLSTIFTTNFILLSNLYSEEKYSKEELDNYIYEYIMNNPEVILKSVDKFRQKTEDNAKVDDEYIKENFIKFANNPNIPYMGSDKPKVIIIEFFDYNCGYCKKSLDAVTELLRTEFDLKISFRDYPILAPSSRTAAKAALASREQGKYFIFHSALMNMQGNLNEDKIFSIATNLGINLNKLKEDMDKLEIDNIIKDNETLAKKLNIRGTPTFIINGELYAGALELNKLKTIIDKALNDS
jgi:protein-disulfide isomerase